MPYSVHVGSSLEWSDSPLYAALQHHPKDHTSRPVALTFSGEGGDLLIHATFRLITITVRRLRSTLSRIFELTFPAREDRRSD